MQRTSTPIPHKILPVGKAYDPNTEHGHYDLVRDTIDRVVIHSIVGTIDGANAVFNNDSGNYDRSAHYGVGLDGSLVQWVSESATAYHAANYSMNKRSIGIEHEDNGKAFDPRSDALYATSAKLVADICQFYQIPIDRNHIIKHNEVQDPNNPNKKVSTQCPGSLDIDRIVREAQQLVSPQKRVMLEAEIFEALVSKGRSLDEIGRYLGLPESQFADPSFYKMVIERIKQIQTAANLAAKPTKNDVIVNDQGDTIAVTPQAQGIIQDLQKGLAELANLFTKKK